MESKIRTAEEVRVFAGRVVAFKCSLASSYLSGGACKFSVEGREEWTYGVINSEFRRAHGFVAGSGHKVHILYKSGLMAGGAIFLTTPEITSNAGIITMRFLETEELRAIDSAVRDNKAAFEFGFGSLCQGVLAGELDDCTISDEPSSRVSILGSGESDAMSGTSSDTS